MSTLIDISGLDKAAVLQVLHAAANRKTRFASILPITTEQARLLLVGGQAFGCLYGRILGVSLYEDAFWPGEYDEENGPGSAEAAIDHLRRENWLDTAGPWEIARRRGGQ